MNRHYLLFEKQYQDLIKEIPTQIDEGEEMIMLTEVKRRITEDNDTFSCLKENGTTVLLEFDSIGHLIEKGSA